MLSDAISCQRPVPCLATTIEACVHCDFFSHLPNRTRLIPFILHIGAAFSRLPGCHLDSPSCTHDTRRRTHKTTTPSFTKPTRLQPLSRCLPMISMSTTSTKTALRLSMARSVSRSGGHQPQPRPARRRRYHGHTSLSSLLMCVHLSPEVAPNSHLQTRPKLCLLFADGQGRLLLPASPNQPRQCRLFPVQQGPRRLGRGRPPPRRAPETLTRMWLGHHRGGRGRAGRLRA